MRRTSLYDRHAALGARMVPFAGWEMPVSYPSGTVAEVKACRASVGIFDVSHMGELSVSGEEARSFLQDVTANDVSRLHAGEAQYSLLLNPSGGVIDDIIVYCQGEREFLVVVNASRHDDDLSWILKNCAGRDAAVSDRSDATALIAVQGPSAVDIVRRHVQQMESEVNRFHFASCSFDGVPILASRTGYTGEDGFEIFCDTADAPHIWDILISDGAVPCGLGARDVLRLEAAYPLYGHELDDTHTPLESGTGWATKLNKGEFIGRDALLQQKQNGVAAKLVGLKMVEPPNAIPREGLSVLSRENACPVGSITSGTLSPSLGCGIAMARVGVDLAMPGTRLQVDVRGRMVGAEVVKMPFYRNGV